MKRLTQRLLVLVGARKPVAKRSDWTLVETTLTEYLPRPDARTRSKESR